MKIFQTHYSQHGLKKELPGELDSEKTLIFVFFSPDLKNSPIFQEINQKFKKSRIIGCSGAGEILGDEVHDGQMVITICKFENPSTKIRLIEEVIEDSKKSFETGFLLGQSLNARDLTAIFVLSEGLNINGSKMVEGLCSVLNPHVMISGGMAGDTTEFKCTYLYSGGTPQTDRVLALGIYGDSLRFHSTAKGGWQPFGIERTVTKSKDNVLFEIDHRPALSLYHDFLGKESVHLPASGLIFPLQVNSNQRHSGSVVRTLLSVNESDQSMFFAGDIPEGSKIFLMRASFADLVNASSNAAQDLRAHFDQGEPLLSLVVSCVGRRLVLGERTEDELECIGKHFMGPFYQTGFYSYGELAPGNAGFCDLHNQTMTLTWIQEKKSA